MSKSDELQLSRNPSPTFVVVQDAEGIVGAFETPARACEMLQGFAGVPFVFHAWPGGGEHVWCVPYRDSVAVAFATTTREAAVTMQGALMPVGLVETDDVDFWRTKMNSLVGPAQRRLDQFAETIRGAREAGAGARKEAESLDDEASARFLEFAGGRPAALDESRVNIFAGVVPVSLPLVPASLPLVPASLPLGAGDVPAEKSGSPLTASASSGPGAKDLPAPTTGS